MLKDIIFATIFIVIVFGYIITVFNEDENNPPFA